MALYLTYWFPKREQARALALLIAASPVATILGAPVSGLILDHVHWLGVGSWRRYHVAIPAIIAGVALALLGTTRSPVCSVILLSFVAVGVYSFYGPFWALPSEFLTGFSAAAGIALINSVGNLGGFAGPYMIGAIAMRTGNLYAGLAIAGVWLFISATLVLLLPRNARAGRALIGRGRS